MPAFSPADCEFMAQAIRLAQRGIYSCHPNPRVGCVLVKDGKVVGRGWHIKAGEGHAEINALADAGDDARGAIAYVSLEPCSHHGKTPPCVNALVDAGIVEVVAAGDDPNPKVAGAGFAALRDAGIAVRSG
ncbi:MAG: diaminohydroxyphosphoribosylaminopyrimidine deaminase, partial [Woeseiaceae bacterium]